MRQEHHDTEVIVVGAGPYGLTAGIQLRRAGVAAQVFGDPMGFWRRMPRGMLLRSNWTATSVVEIDGPLSLDSFVAETGTGAGTPIPLETFVRYGEWIQERALPDLERRLVARLDRTPTGFVATLSDGDRITAKRAVIAGGIEAFAWTPPEFASLPGTHTSHASAHSDLSCFSGKTVGVVGGGQSALESAALLAESGAQAEVFVRRPNVVWLRGQSVKRRLGALGNIVYAPTDVGPLWYSRLVSAPRAFRLLPRAIQEPVARRCVRPAGSAWVRRRLEDVELHLGTLVMDAALSGACVELALSDGSTRTVDHLLLGTGYRVDISRYGFLGRQLVRDVATIGGYPRLRTAFESSVPGLHFLGAPAAWSYGPIMRFVSGSVFSGRTLAAHVGGGPRDELPPRYVRDLRPAPESGQAA